MAEGSITYGTMAGANYSWTVSPTRGERPEPTPSGLIATRAVETREGWLGQVIIDKEIVFQTDPYREGEDAIKVANGHVVGKVKALFA
jgi:hypothetical protein